MKINDIISEDGRIVPGVNTTVDVKPGETERQAAKFFGNKGKPKPLGIKGATPNQAFNLGLTESYKLQLERGDGMDILHILDTKTGHRTEVRGKPNFEIEYDPNDPLHKVINSLGKSANISDFVNGEVVTINPKHPDGEKAKAATDTAFNESNEPKEMKISDLTISDAGVAIATAAGGGSRTDAPLDVTKLPSGHVWLINGYHRLIDAMKAGKDTVPVEFVPFKQVEILWKNEREQDIQYGKKFNEAFDTDDLDERKLTKKEIKKRDRLIDELPDAEFKKRYGKDWEAVKYGTATNMAKESEEIEENIYQSAALKVLDNIAQRRDGQAHPVKFYDGSTLKVKPETARKFISFYDDSDKERQHWIKNYLRTKKGFLELMSPKFIEGKE
jgi:hypothetical protein